MTASTAIMKSVESWNWSLIISTLALGLAILTLRRGNKNSSVASMIPLNAEIRDMWTQYVSSFKNIEFDTIIELETFERDIINKLERLMNVVEIAAAIKSKAHSPAYPAT